MHHSHQVPQSTLVDRCYIFLLRILCSRRRSEERLPDRSNSCLGLPGGYLHEPLGKAMADISVEGLGVSHQRRAGLVRYASMTRKSSRVLEAAPMPLLQQVLNRNDSPARKLLP